MEEPEKQLEEMEERGDEVDRKIEETESDWGSTQQEVPSTVDDATMGPSGEEPLDDENPIGGV